MAVRMALATISAELTAALAHLNSGTVVFRTGSQPATPETAATGTLVGTLTLPNPAGTVSGTTLTFGSITADSAADADGGSSGWFRVYRSDGTTAVMDGTYGLSAADAIISVAIVAGAEIAITSMTLGLPASA